ncbi:MAG TPA: phosphoglycolate phosphatase [Steroidobacteraceae bacterium]|jgi:2-phosphoglycolate phosphatase|nr:phosphoglycolate phosphatase [Steroidobacteraceae bacterium]
MALRAVLFDLDGTLLDTAPDMVGALNALRREELLAPLPYESIRSAVSHGAARVVKAGFPDASPENAQQLQRRFLEIYRGALSRETRLFPGMGEALDALTRWGIKSGIVTNKAAWLTEPLLEEMGLRERFACVVSGDTLAERKPHPMPLLHAAALAEVSPGECIYVGDAERDVQAAHAAAMPALVANYGYVRADEDTRQWGGDGYLEQPLDLLDWLKASGRL